MTPATFPAFEAHPDVWLIVGGLAASYVVALTRLGPIYAPGGASRRRAGVEDAPDSERLVQRTNEGVPL